MVEYSGVEPGNIIGWDSNDGVFRGDEYDATKEIRHIKVSVMRQQTTQNSPPYKL